jgi:hypothetical protein
MKRETLKINKNGETLTITKSATETNGQITEFEGTDEPGVGPPMHAHSNRKKWLR